MSTVGSTPDMASPGGQDDTLLVVSVDEGGRHADCTAELKAINCQIDCLLSPHELSYHSLGNVTSLSSFAFLNMLKLCASVKVRAIVCAFFVIPKLKNKIKTIINVLNSAYLL